MGESEHGLYRAEHRGLRELHAATRHLAGHWTKLADRVGGPCTPTLQRGAELAGELLDALAGRIPGTPAAQGVGGRFAGLRNNAGDLLLERNQAMRAAVLDAQHVTTLLGYLQRLAATRGDDELAAFHGGWEERMRALEQDARAAAVAIGEEPAAAVEPAEPGALGRAGHQLAVRIGSAGEAIDSSPLARRFARR